MIMRTVSDLTLKELMMATKLIIRSFINVYITLDASRDVRISVISWSKSPGGSSLHYTCGQLVNKSMTLPEC